MAIYFSPLESDLIVGTISDNSSAVSSSNDLSVNELNFLYPLSRYLFTTLLYSELACSNTYLLALPFLLCYPVAPEPYLSLLYPVAE